MNQVELLLRLSENAQDRGDELAQKHTAERQAHTKELSELYRLLELAMQNLHAEMLRWGVIQPKAQHLPETSGSSPPQRGPGGGPAPAFLQKPGGNSEQRPARADSATR